MKVTHTLDTMPRRGSVALGCFDGLHIGHRRVVECAVDAKHRGLSPVVFTFQENPMKQLKGASPPILLENDRKIILLREMGVEALYMIPFEAVMAMEAEQFVEEVLIKRCRAEKLCCGFNFHFGRGGRGDGSLLKALCPRFGCEAAVVPPVQLGGAPVSSSRIRAALADGDAELAAALLGQPFGFDFEVVHGRHLGSLLGAPTINQPFPEGFVQPRFGVYASRSHVEGKALCSVTNIGVKPTVGSERVLAETWIPDYSGDLYGKHVYVELLGFLRPEKKFADLTALKEEIFRNRREAENFVKKRYG